MTAEKARKKYKGYINSRRIFIVLAVVFCLLPIAFAVLFIFPEIKNAESIFALGGGTVSILVIIAFIFKTLIKNCISKIPHTVTVFVSVVVFLVVIFLLKTLFGDAVSAVQLTANAIGDDASVISRGVKLLNSVFSVVDDTFAYLTVQAIGAAVGIFFELAAMYCKSMIEEIKLFYGKDEENGTE